MHDNRGCGRFHRIFLAGLLTATIAQVSRAGELTVALQECRSEKEDARRLACYDREVAVRSPVETTGTAASAADPAAILPSSEELFGYEKVHNLEQRSKDPSGAAELKELVSTVTGISRRPDGVLVVTLENGQVWSQKTADPDFRLKVGEQATIRRTIMGSFFLYGVSSWSTRVARLH